MASITVADVCEMMESGLTASYGPIEVNFCNFWPHPSALNHFMYEACSRKVNGPNCGAAVATNICGHDARAQRIVRVVLSKLCHL